MLKVVQFYFKCLLHEIVMSNDKDNKDIIDLCKYNV